MGRDTVLRYRPVSRAPSPGQPKPFLLAQHRSLAPIAGLSVRYHAHAEGRLSAPFYEKRSVSFDIQMLEARRRTRLHSRIVTRHPGRC